MCARLRAYELRVTSVDYVVDLGKSPDPRRPHPRSTAIPKRKSSGETGPHAPPPSRTSRGARIRGRAQWTATRNNTVYTSTLMPRNGERTGPGGLLYAHPRDPGGPRHTRDQPSAPLGSQTTPIQNNVRPFDTLRGGLGHVESRCTYPPSNKDVGSCVGWKEPQTQQNLVARNGR